MRPDLLLHHSACLSRNPATPGSSWTHIVITSDLPKCKLIRITPKTLPVQARRELTLWSPITCQSANFESLLKRILPDQACHVLTLSSPMRPAKVQTFNPGFQWSLPHRSSPMTCQSANFRSLRAHRSSPRGGTKSPKDEEHNGIARETASYPWKAKVLMTATGKTETNSVTRNKNCLKSSQSSSYVSSKSWQGVPSWPWLRRLGAAAVVILIM